MIKIIFRSLFVDDLLEIPGTPAYPGVQAWKQRLMRDLARITLFSYFLLMFNPVMPLIADKMAHTFWKEYHLIAVHQVNGTFHVHVEMSKAMAQADKGRSAGNNKSYSEEYTHVISATSYDFLSFYCISLSYIPYQLQSPVSYPVTHYQPPKISFQHFELV